MILRDAERGVRGTVYEENKKSYVSPMLQTTKSSHTEET